ncbi:unnamed protein product [Sympodiomycopsis kandeliae]
MADDRDILAQGPRRNFAVVIDNMNDSIARSFVGKWFRLDGSGHILQREGSRFTTELRAGIITAASMMYIISVNASILSQTGGNCVCTADNCETDVSYTICREEVRQDYVTATSAMATIASVAMGLLANLPVGLAPGLGVNAYLAFSVVGEAGRGGLTTFGGAFAAVFLEGWLFFFLSVFGLRQMIGRLLPRSLALATGAGIGAYLAFVGLSSAGLSVVGGNYSNLVGLGGCLPEHQDDHGYCTGGVLRDPRVWAGIFGGGVLTALLLMYRVRGALLWPILLVSIASWPRTSAITLFTHDPMGDTRFDFFKKVATWHSFKHLGPSNIDWNAYGSGKVWLALIVFLYTDALDTTGTLFAMSRQAGLFDDRSADFEGSSVAFLVDAVCISIGSLMNMSPVTAFIESSTGIVEGGRTGLVGITVGFMFFLSLFFAPIFSSLPSWATGSTLVIVGSFMLRNAAYISWSFPSDAIPAFITIIGMPLTYSIAYGIIGGVISWIILHWTPTLIHYASFKYIPMPYGWDTDKEPYTLWQMVDGRGWRGVLDLILPPWMLRLLGGKAKFWQPSQEEMESYLEGRRWTKAKADAIEEQRDQQREAMRRSRRDHNDHDLESQDDDELNSLPHSPRDIKVPMEDQVAVPDFAKNHSRTAHAKPSLSRDDDIELDGRR